FFFQAEDGIRDRNVTGVQTCALPISVAFSIGEALFELGVGGAHIGFPIEGGKWRCIGVCEPLSVRRREIVLRGRIAELLPCLEYLGRDKPSVLVIVVALSVVLIKHGKLGSIDRAELISSHTEHERDKRIDLDLSLTPVGGEAQR